jgi:hypothetical protein
MSDRTTAARGTPTNVQKAAAIVGIVFLLVGVLVFIPVSPPPSAICHSPATSPTPGCSGCSRCRCCITSCTCSSRSPGMARTAAQARTYLAFGGAIYLVLFVYGLIVGQESAANIVHVNTADDFLHLILGIHAGS